VLLYVFFFAFHFCWADAGGHKLLGIQGKQDLAKLCTVTVRALGAPLRNIFTE
jgi:hypothetical protein